MTPQDIGPKPKRVTDTEDYVAALARLIDGYGRRVADDPAAACYLPDLQQRLTDSVNVGLATAQGKQGGWSLREIARYMGVSHVAISKRSKQGREIIARREQAAGVVRLADAVKPSVPALREQRAEYLAANELAEYRERRHGKHRRSA